MKESKEVKIKDISLFRHYIISNVVLLVLLLVFGISSLFILRESGQKFQQVHLKYQTYQGFQAAYMQLNVIHDELAALTLTIDSKKRRHLRVKLKIHMKKFILDFDKNNALMQSSNYFELNQYYKKWHSIWERNWDLFHKIIAMNTKLAEIEDAQIEVQKLLSGINNMREFLALMSNEDLNKYQKRTSKNMQMVSILLGIILFLALFFILNLTRRFKLVATALATLNKSLENANTKVNTLLQVVSHDVVNYLQIIGVSSKLLEKKLQTDVSGPYPSGYKQVLMIQKAVINLKQLVENVRHIELLELEEDEMRTEAVFLKDIIDEIKFVFEERANKKMVKLDFIYENEDLALLVEPISFKHDVINNLISNAIKFSYEFQSVTLIAEEKGNLVHLQVKDQGIGMSEKLLADIFSVEKKTTRVGTSGEKGTGFGLPIAKIYIEKYDGTIEVTSKNISDFPDDHGTTIDLYLKKAA